MLPFGFSMGKIGFPHSEYSTLVIIFKLTSFNLFFYMSIYGVWTLSRLYVLRVSGVTLHEEWIQLYNQEYRQYHL